MASGILWVTPFVSKSTFSDAGQFWAPGNFELIVLAHPHERRE